MHVIAIGQLLSRFSGILESNLNGIQAQFFCDRVQLGFYGKTDLWSTMTALWAANGIVCIDGIPFVFQIGNPIGNHAEAPRQEYDHDPAPSIAPAIIDDPELLSEQGTIFPDARFEFHDQGLAMAIGTKDLLA